MKVNPSGACTLLLTLSLSLTSSVGLAQDGAATPSSSGMAQLLGDLKKSSDSPADPALKSVGGDLGSKLSALSKSLADNPDAQKQLQGAVQSLLGDKGASSLAALQKLSQAKLTPEQTKLTKDVYNAGSAYVVQKNFGSLEGSQSEVSQVVNSLRKGSYAETLPALKKIGENAKLTQPQKDLLSSLADQYAPGLKKAGDALKAIPGLNNPTPAAPGTK